MGSSAATFQPPSKELAAEMDDVVDALLQPLRRDDPNAPPLPLPVLQRVLDAAEQALAAEPSLLELDGPLQVCGDISGHFTSLLRIFHEFGRPPATRYLFLGNYCCRGSHGMKVLLLLLALKVRYPSRVFLLRGFQEVLVVSRIYGFYDECKRRTGIKVFRLFSKSVFEYLPIAALIGGRIFCVHGGLCPALESLDQIRRLVRPSGGNPPEGGLLEQLLCADPGEDIRGWGGNNVAEGYDFGEDVLLEFLQRHGLDLLVRGHQVVENGCEWFGKHHRLVTVFSAANYVNEFNNAAGVLSINERLEHRSNHLAPPTSFCEKEIVA